MPVESTVIQSPDQLSVYNLSRNSFNFSGIVLSICIEHHRHCASCFMGMPGDLIEVHRLYRWYNQVGLRQAPANFATSSVRSEDPSSTTITLSTYCFMQERQNQ